MAHLTGRHGAMRIGGGIPIQMPDDRRRTLDGMGIQICHRCRAVKTRNPSLTGNGAMATTLRLQDCKSAGYKP